MDTPKEIEAYQRGMRDGLEEAVRRLKMHHARTKEQINYYLWSVTQDNKCDRSKEIQKQRLAELKRVTVKLEELIQSLSLAIQG